MANAKIVNTPSQAIRQAGSVHTQRTISSTSVNVLNHVLQEGTSHAIVQFNGADVRVTFDGGTAATTGKGFLFVNGSTAYWTREMLRDAKAIITGETDVVAEIQELNFK
jgi:hypothetical protein